MHLWMASASQASSAERRNLASSTGYFIVPYLCWHRCLYNCAMKPAGDHSDISHRAQSFLIFQPFLFSALLDALQCPAWEERLERKGLLLPTLYGAVRKQPLWFVTACSKNIQRAVLVPSSTNTHGLPWDEKHLAVHPEVSSSGQRHGLISACFLHSKTTLLSSDCFQLRKTNEH